MIILEGPDGSGKSTLARKLESAGLKYYHFDKEGKYTDYIEPLCKLEMIDAVLDRHAISEYPYSICMNRPFKYSPKQWHNIILLTLAQNPVIILCTHKATMEEYADEHYLPYGKWDQCLAMYRRFFDHNHIRFLEYNYSERIKPSVFSVMESKFRGRARWWVPMWKEGVGMIGSHSPEVLLVAQNMGPSNVNLLPFESGPTGHMLSAMFKDTNTPLGSVAVTNMIKAPRGTMRNVNDRDLELFREEVTHLNPKKIVFMGAFAKAGIPIANEFGIPYHEIPHLGFLKHSGITDMTQYNAVWRSIIGGMKGVWS